MRFCLEVSSKYFCGRQAVSYRKPLSLSIRFGEVSSSAEGREQRLTTKRTARQSRTKLRSISRKDAKAANASRCHFERREKSFLDLSYPLGMTAFAVTWRLCDPSALLRTCLAGGIPDSECLRLQILCAGRAIVSIAQNRKVTHRYAPFAT
jgi:hypothetical protein